MTSYATPSISSSAGARAPWFAAGAPWFAAPWFAAPWTSSAPTSIGSTRRGATVVTSLSIGSGKTTGRKRGCAGAPESSSSSASAVTSEAGTGAMGSPLRHVTIGPSCMLGCFWALPSASTFEIIPSVIAHFVHCRPCRRLPV